MDTPEKSHGFVFRTLVSQPLDRVTQREIDRDIARYATRPDGSRDTVTAGHLRLELERRNAMGQILDIKEPLQYAAYGSAFSVAAGAGLVMSKERSLPTRATLAALMASSAISAASQVIRMYPRFRAGLQGGRDAALAMARLDAEGCENSGSWTQTVDRVQSDAAPTR